MMSSIGNGIFPAGLNSVLRFLAGLFPAKTVARQTFARKDFCQIGILQARTIAPERFPAK